MQEQGQDSVKEPLEEPAQELVMRYVRSLAGPGRSMLVQPGKGTLTHNK